jgi:hypothetical protein
MMPRNFLEGKHDAVLHLAARQEQAPEYLGAFHKAEIDKWWPIIKAAGIKGR